MLKTINIKFLLATALSFAALNTIELPKPISHLGEEFNLSQQALARSSGGRGGGGSFSRPSGGSRPSGSGSGSGGGGYSRRDYDSDYYGRRGSGYGYGGPNVVIVPGGGGYYGGGYYGGGASIFPMLLILGFFGLMAFLLMANRLQSSRGYGYDNSYSGMPTGASHERDNDIVTVSKLQVALLSTAKGVQTQLASLIESVDTSTSQGLLELTQESALLLLRNSEYWSHVLASSDSMRIQQAEASFNQLSLRERSKFSAETLTNVGGTLRRKDFKVPGLAEDPGAYIVVTLLVGTAGDKPLFKDVRSAPALKDALERVAAVPADYLMKVEVLWSPQVEADSLTYDELLTEYTDMVQIA